MISRPEDYETVFHNIVQTLRYYLSGHPVLKSLVVGLSGGIDSALTCALAYEVLKDIDSVTLIGRTIPIESNTPQETERAQSIGNAFCDDFEVKDLTIAAQHLYNEVVSGTHREKDSFTHEKVRRGNIKARTRMVYLFDLAHFHNGMVLSTDNYTELLLGFWTLHGDVGNYGILQYLWKTEVYGLAGYLVKRYTKLSEGEKAKALNACIDAVPTDGLGITGSDFDQIGVTTYKEADEILIGYLNGSLDHADHPVIKRHLASSFKRVDPQNIDRQTLLKGTTAS